MGDLDFHPPSMLCKNCLHSIDITVIQDLYTSLINETTRRTAVHPICQECIGYLEAEHLHDLQKAVIAEILDRRFDQKHGQLAPKSIQDDRHLGIVSDSAMDGCMNGLFLKRAQKNPCNDEDIFTRCLPGRQVFDPAYNAALRKVAEDSLLLATESAAGMLIICCTRIEPAETPPQDSQHHDSPPRPITPIPPNESSGTIHLGTVGDHRPEEICQNCLVGLNDHFLEGFRQRLEQEYHNRTQFQEVCGRCINDALIIQVCNLREAVNAEHRRRFRLRKLERHDPEAHYQQTKSDELQCSWRHLGNPSAILQIPRNPPGKLHLDCFTQWMKSVQEDSLTS
ncbi:hypothetical protein HGRIS_012013 [Hohenbuehelia grisea]|uniref:ZAD domain-containing protein n=1 Tax=Hohenbuehelia grisea TaxID=104357 RepID=A0ABR3IP27_9AGAR